MLKEDEMPLWYMLLAIPVGVILAGFGIYWSVVLIKRHLAEEKGRDPNLD